MQLKLDICPRDTTTSFLVLRHLRRHVLKKEKLPYKQKTFKFSVTIPEFLTEHSSSGQLQDGIEWPVLDEILSTTARYFDGNLMNDFPSVTKMIFR